MKSERIIISRTDSIGDVMLTLPMCGLIKAELPESTIIFLGSNYTKDIIEACHHIDSFVSWDELKELPFSNKIEYLRNLKADVIIHVFPKKELTGLAKAAKIPIRVATAGRFYTFFNCNRKVYFSRRNSELHEAQLNMLLLAGIGIHRKLPISEIHLFYGFSPTQYPANLPSRNRRFQLIIHPLSRGSALGWCLENFQNLIEKLPENQFQVYITGSEKEGELIRKVIRPQENVTFLTGKLSLSELIGFISKCDGLLAASTGPLHIAAALGIHAIGLYTNLRPMHPARWGPIGKNTHVISTDKMDSSGQGLKIEVSEVLHIIEQLAFNKSS